MVQANQLRLGNYIFNTCHDCETIVRVTSIDSHQIGCGIEGVKINLCYQFEDFKPIPLTEKLLADFPQVQPLKIESHKGFFYYTGSGQFVRLEYIHQLQNLYFAITGEELPLDIKIIAEAVKSIPATVEMPESPYRA